MSIRDALTELLLPAACAACTTASAAGSGLCRPCAAALPQGPPVLATPRVRDAPPTVAAAAYEEPLAAILNAYKEHHRRELARVLAPMLMRAFAAVAAELPGDRPPAMVPIPATRQALRTRGFDHVALLCPRALRRSCLTARPRPDSVGLSPRRRLEEARRSLAVRPRRTAALAASGRAVVLVDDIATTGATVSAAARALRGAGVDVRAAVVVAAVR